MDIGIFFRGTTTPLVKTSEFFYMFKNTKFDEFFYTEYNWELAYYTLIDKHDIRLEPDFLFNVNFLWDCANYPDTEFLIKNNMLVGGNTSDIKLRQKAYKLIQKSKPSG